MASGLASFVEFNCFRMSAVVGGEWQRRTNSVVADGLV
jgi:hypothetical protein